MVKATTERRGLLVTFQIPKEIKNKIDELSKELNISKSEIYRQAVFDKVSSLASLANKKTSLGGVNTPPLYSKKLKEVSVPS